MRYFIVTYMQRAPRRTFGAHGMPVTLAPQQDEVVSMSRSLRAKDIATASVILDFRDRLVVKASVGGQVATRDFATIRNYYHQHYAEIIDQLESEQNEQTNDPG